MRPNRLKEIWARDEAAIGAWCTVPSSLSAEIMAHCGVDWACIDTQHGSIDYSDVLPMLQAISTTDTVPIVRVQWNDPGFIMKMLDAGAYGVIVPMVNTREQAKMAIDACRYAPQGARSYGPGRAVMYAGGDYFQKANETVLCFCMIETAESIENAEEIISTPGLDGVYIGPSDLSVSLGLPPAPDQADASFNAALDKVLTLCKKYQVVPGVHCATPSIAKKRIEQGFRFVEMCDDAGMLARTVNAAVAELRTGVPKAPQMADA